MLILGVDLETTGLNPKEDEITEVGAVLWDTEFSTPVKFFNYLVAGEQTIPPDLVKLTGITNELRDKHGVPGEDFIKELTALLYKADYCVAHNAPFDRGFLGAFFEKHSFIMLERTWIDSSVDVPYPPEITTRKLTHLAAEHKFVNPFAHRAVTDVLTMLAVCCQYSWDALIESAKQPNITLHAKVNFSEKEKAKQAGYRWNGKVWLKTIKENKHDEEKETALRLGFTIGDWNG